VENSLKEKSDKDDPSRTCREPESGIQSLVWFRNALPLAQVPLVLSIQTFFSELILIGVLLLLSLLFSALRAAYGVTSTAENPWERRSAAEPLLLSAPQKLTLSLLQRGSTLMAFLLAAHLAWKITQNPEFSPFAWIPAMGLIGWLWVDALVRYYAGHNALGFTRKVTPLLKPTARFLTRSGNVFTKLGTQWRILLPDEAKGRSEQHESEPKNEEERDLLRGLATFGQTTARQTMQPRLNITAVDIELDFHELMDKINKSGYSRIPVYTDTLDSVEGILYVKDLLPHLHRDEHFTWQKLLRKAYFIPESKRLDDLMQEFQNRRVHMAIVVDEYGGTNGLITLEDIIEEIFGDINDEYDEAEEVNYTQVDDKTYIFEGKVLINDFCKILNLEPEYFEDVRRASESLGGLLLELFSQLPRTGEQITHRDLTFKVQSADKKRIKKVRVIVS
jgi:putative hemolysin